MMRCGTRKPIQVQASNIKMLIAHYTMRQPINVYVSDSIIKCLLIIETLNPYSMEFFNVQLKIKYNLLLKANGEGERER